MKRCKKCLLLEAGEKVTYEEIQKYVNSLDKELLISDSEYQKRITNCINCENILSGMCVKCGCYVEIRARLKDKECPDYDNRKW